MTDRFHAFFSQSPEGRTTFCWWRHSRVRPGLHSVLVPLNPVETDFLVPSWFKAQVDEWHGLPSRLIVNATWDDICQKLREFREAQDG